ncbi:MAG: hypothetical protein Q9187_006317 [Circinaria calcarea]
MSRAVADILNCLIPGHNGSLPSPLVELALCLLAQSRSQASALKAEEEIARSYVCAHLACESLRTGTIRRGRPPKNKTHDPVPNDLPYDSGSRLGRQARTTRQTAPRDVPSWIMPAIRRLCSGMDAPAAPPHVFAGVSSILTLPSPNDSHDEIELLASVDNNKPRIYALIISVYLLVAMLLRGRQINDDERIKETDQALCLLNGMETSRAEKEIARVEDVDDWLAKLHGEGWLDLDWHQNVPRGLGLEISSSMVDMVQQLDDGAEQTEPKLPFTRAYYMQDAKVPGNTLQPGLGTMVCLLSAVKTVALTRSDARKCQLSEFAPASRL